MSQAAGAVLAVERGWLVMPMEDLKDAIECIVWGYPEPVLSLDELVAGCKAEYGWDAANRFHAALGQGCKRPKSATKWPWSFAGLCSSYGEFEPLRRLCALPAEHLMRGFHMTPAQWLDHLCTRVTSSGELVTFGIWKIGNDLARGGLEVGVQRARECFELGLTYQPNHPDVDELLAAGTPGAALLSEMLMERQIERTAPHQSAASAAPARRAGRMSL